MKKKRNDGISGVLLLAKRAGRTSFSSLSSVKNALRTEKVGHTGTLDSFAEGLLVVLVGNLTRLAPHITGMDKTYRALIEFGSETDTLDPSGRVVKTGRVPSKDDVLAALPKFVGETLQAPPAYSALHVDGKRASDLAREGKSVALAPRKITISSIELLDFYDNLALVEVSCSKGTYIRSLARDIASECGTVAHLRELCRTRVGSFRLEDAVDCDDPAAIRGGLLPMTAGLASLCGMDSAWIATRYISDFNNGKALDVSMLVRDFRRPWASSETAVFYPDGDFGGVVSRRAADGGGRLSYGFVVPGRQRMRIYSWEQVSSGRFDPGFRSSGTALTIGSFDGSHLGHRALFDAVLSRKSLGLVPGVLTFTKSLRGYKNPGEYEGDVVSLSQKIENLTAAGFEFAVIVDFSADFCKIEGHDFLSSLVRNCGLKFLAEGSDFHCGYKGLLGMEEIRSVSGGLGFSVETIGSVIFEGERVSSSRIRRCILERNFSSAREMLFRPFELDCAGFDWRVEGGNVISAAKKGAQLLPPDGAYPVSVSFFDLSQKSGEAQNSRAAIADCTLENGNLRLAFSDNLISGFVRSVQFL